VDGDTIIIRQQDSDGIAHRARVRLLGIDAPESVKPGSPVEPWSEEAATMTATFLDAGEARIELDKRRVDRYDRFLAYIYVGDKMLNEELLRAGLARHLSYPGDSAAKSRLFQNAENEARNARRGIWSTGGMR
jgi:micrococcal nuclease